MINPCFLCTARCCKDYLITVTSFDVLRIMKKTKMKPTEFAALYPATILNRDNETVLECYYKGQRYEYLLALKSYPCVFLDEKDRCKIYEIAPLACRKYPMENGRDLIKRAACPFFSKILFRMCYGARIKPEEFKRQITDYKKIVSKWNKKHGKKDACLDFLIKESEKMYSSHELE